MDGCPVGYRLGDQVFHRNFAERFCVGSRLRHLKKYANFFCKIFGLVAALCEVGLVGSLCERRCAKAPHWQRRSQTLRCDCPQGSRICSFTIHPIFLLRLCARQSLYPGTFHNGCITANPFILFKCFLAQRSKGAKFFRIKKSRFIWQNGISVIARALRC